MAYSINTHTITGGQDEFDLSFAGESPGYIEEEHVRYYIGENVQDNSARTFLTSTRVQISPVPVDGTEISFRRETSPEEPLVDWEARSAITEELLDRAHLQAIYLAQESDDKIEYGLTDIQASEDAAAVSASEAEASAVRAEEAADGITGSTITTPDVFVGNSIQTDFTMTTQTVNEYTILVQVGGVLQHPSSYSVDATGLILTIPGPVATGLAIVVRNLGNTKAFADVDAVQDYVVDEIIAQNTSYMPDASEADQGVVGTELTMKAAVVAIGTNKGTITLRHDSANETTTYTLNTSLEIPENITLVIENGAVISGVGTLSLPGRVVVYGGDSLSTVPTALTNTTTQDEGYPEAGPKTLLSRSTTTDATPTTAQSIPVSEGSMGYVESKVVGVSNDSSVRCGYTIHTLVHRVGAGDTVLGDTTQVFVEETDAGLEAVHTVSGDSVYVVVTGVAATTMLWKVRTTIMEV